MPACAQCGGQNSADSRFCRHCGAEQKAAKLALSAVSAPAVAVPAMPAQPSSLSGLAPEALAPRPTAPAGAVAELSAQEIDARRSRQLLERAQGLADKGEQQAAILACRQAIALAPEAVGGYSMLGLLLERGGETGAAMVAYRKVLELAPDSSVERDSLQRLRTTMQQNQTSSVFHFDAQELFPTDAEGNSAPAVPPATQDLKSTPGKAASSVAAIAPQVSDRRSVPRSITGDATVGDRRSVPRTAPDGTVIVRRAADGSIIPEGAAGYARALSPIAPPTARPNAAVFAPVAEAPSGPRWLRSLGGEHSYYLQTAPLLAATMLGLVFLLWARGVAVSRAQQADVAAIDTASQMVPSDQTAQGQSDTGAALPPGTAALGTVEAVPNAAVPGVASPGVVAPGGAAPGGNTPASSPGTPLAPRQPRVSAVPRSITSGSTRIARGNPTPNPLSGLGPVRSNTGSGTTTPATVVAPAPAPPTRAVTSISSSTGGRPLATGNAPRGYVRITGDHPGLATAGIRPENRARNEEDAARADARAGRAASAIDRATASLDGGRDTGWRFQQRALLRLENGDNAGAASDFQSAINAYRDQISRGTRVDDARRGITACQSGLRLALANTRG